MGKFLAKLWILLPFIILGAAGYAAYKLFFNTASSAIVWNHNSPITTDPVSFSLDLTNPDDGSLVFDKNMTISGKTSPNAIVIVNDDGENTQTQASSTGDFSQSITLDNGLNTVIITAFNDSGDQKSANRTIYYSKDQI